MTGIRFLSYLNSISSQLTEGHMDHILLLWERMLPLVSKLPVAILTKDDEEKYLQLSWTADREHLSLDIYENGSYWFYRHRELDYCRANDQDKGILTKEFLEKLK